MNPEIKQKNISSKRAGCRRGFSFIELMIVVTIISIMTSVGLLSLTNSRNRKALETEARKVGASLRQAQNNALTGKEGVSSGDWPCIFRWRNYLDKTSYWIRTVSKDSGGVCTSVEGSDDVKYSLQNGATFKFTTPDILDFAVPFGGVTDQSNPSDNRIIVKKGSNCIDITINAGQVTEGAVYSGTDC